MSLTGVLALAGPGGAKEETADIVNIINFIRGVEPRTQMDLVEPVREQLALGKKHRLPTTWLIQYDALIKPEFTDLLKREMNAGDEIGAWLEVVQPQVEAAGLKWRGRFPWDWHTDVGFTQGYAVKDRIKLLDLYMEKFQEVFGKLPESVGCWILDAPTLNHLRDEYGIIAACNCKDQSGTDGYTLWGGYWNQAYYPSRLNAYMPAQTKARQLDVPVFRMLGSDPVHQYDHGIGTTWQGVVTLEPVYRPGGGDPSWVDWFFNTNFNRPSLGFSYMQAGQENSFGWPAMSAGLIDQYAKLAALRDEGKIRVETLAASGQWFASKYETTPATAVVAMEDAAEEANRSIWYESRFYRVNFSWERDRWRIRDLHRFNENYEERYLHRRVEGPTAIYDTLPVLDGFHWSRQGELAGIRAVVHEKGESRPLLTKGEPRVEETSPESLAITCNLAAGGVLRVTCEPTRLHLQLTGDAAPADWGLELGWADGVKIPVTRVGRHGIDFRHEGFSYSLDCGSSGVSRAKDANRISIGSTRGSVEFDFASGSSGS
ncbi:hypothetical protein [Luteolibacter marinus]|uniref:hypothetical protein n=1 Tax=Luteolibacter marinus TaxID=2776705 RepID=UPI001867BDB6|nr:hypothetical protein [Luteolibacter marinus]